MLDRQEQKRKVQGEEEREEHYGGSQREEKTAGGEEEPAPEVEGEGAVERRPARGRFVRGDDVEGRCEDYAEGDPEAAVYTRLVRVLVHISHISLI